MTIEKLPSGSFRIKQMYEGKMYSKTIDHKPTQKEATQIMAQLLHDVTSLKGSFKSAATKYIDLKVNVLSPRTIREYRLLVERIPQWFNMMQLNDINQEHIQRLVNELSADKSPKTIRTYHGFVASILGMFRPNMTIKTTLPQKDKKEPYIPTIEDVRAVFKYSEGTQYSIALKLACMGLRRSEICALTIDDLSDDDVLTIDKALGENVDGSWVLKKPKTTDSTRYIPIDHALAEEIRKQGYVFNGYPGTISNHLARIQKKHGIPQFSLHKMRHFFASQLMDMGVSQKDIAALGGWKTESTILKTVYQHSVRAKTDEGRKEISKQLSNRIF